MTRRACPSCESKEGDDDALRIPDRLDWPAQCVLSCLFIELELNLCLVVVTSDRPRKWLDVQFLADADDTSRPRRRACPLSPACASVARRTSASSASAGRVQAGGELHCQPRVRRRRARVQRVLDYFVIAKREDIEIGEVTRHGEWRPIMRTSGHVKEGRVLIATVSRSSCS